MNRDIIYQMQGELAVLERELEELEISGNNSVITIYNVLNPDKIETSILDLDVLKAAVELKRLTAAWNKARDTRLKSDRIKKKLDEIKAALL